MPPELPASLIDARDRFDTWRRCRRPGTRIPDHLWDLAVQLAQVYGLNRVRKVLNLDHDALKKRLTSAHTDAPAAPAFVELPHAVAITSPECLIELARPDGVCMRLHLKGYHAPDLLALSHRLWMDQ